jgi:streptomycin 6-kinase
VAADEAAGGLLMAWWDGRGAARVLAHEGGAILLERAEGRVSLAELARTGRDDDAARIICTFIAELHASRATPLPGLVTLDRWFADLFPTAASRGGVLSSSAATARALLACPQDVVALHGDIHHGNVLDFGERGWLAIDPKGLVGERGFDHANLFLNPDHGTATAPGRLARRIGIVAEAARLEPERLLRWVLAWAGLSAVWSAADGEPPDTALAVAELAAAELGR